MKSFMKISALLVCLLTSGYSFASGADTSDTPVHQTPLAPATQAKIVGMYKQLIDAENAHDLAAVRPFVLNSPDTLFVAKTKTAAEGNWAGFWGKEVVMQHFGDLYQGTFRIDPEYDKEKVVALAPDIVQTYVPVSITVAYGGQTPVPKPFIMILEWVRTPAGWKMATDIALPVPPAPAGS